VTAEILHEHIGELLLGEERRAGVDHGAAELLPDDLVERKLPDSREGT
jgi:hypothetical protein